MNDLKSRSGDRHSEILPINNLLLTEKMESILSRRIKSKRRVASLDFLDRIHRFEVCEHPVIANRMYASLLSGKLTKEGFQAFFNDYYHASSCGLFLAMRQSLNAYDNNDWRSYIKNMLLEETHPRLHSDLLKEFIEDCDLEVNQFPKVGEKFINDMLKGFTSDIYFALGYSLAIEVEGAYEIDLIQESCSSLFSEQLENTIWFDIHLDSTGEEEHANHAVETIEKIVHSESDLQKLYQGFIKGCDDTFNFMESLFEYVDSLVGAKTEIFV
ncbi:hypothetical protein [Mastigocoleus testarum]|uniref:hypothetical protein n=1 Tax=Mastigocoleus testarum TaxID=996925 RepID=UPI000425F4F0|nr:hypothetical protein [Mastigocoleus testarum]